MAKIMIFIDGTWLYRNMPKLADSYGKTDFQVDYGKLPVVLSNEVKRQLGAPDVDVVRTHLFASYPSNYDLRDEDYVQRQMDFYGMLKEEYHYELESFAIDFRGRRIKAADRDPQDLFRPREKCVDIALATSILYFAAIPYAYDIGIAVVGDRDYVPVLQHARRLGKRVAIASIKESCSPELADPCDSARVKDFDMIWINELLPQIELRYERHQMQCESPMHRGDRKVWTLFHPRKGQRFYCDECRGEFARQKQQAQGEFVSTSVEANGSAESTGDAMIGKTLAGVVFRKLAEKKYGFIRAEDGGEYFFHLTDLKQGLEFDDLREGLGVDFEIKRKPTDKAGAAQNVRLRASQ